MATTTGFIDYTEQTAPANPTASHQRLFVRSSDHVLCLVDSSGTVTPLGASTRASLGLDTTDSPQFAGINLGHASDTTLTRVSAGVVAIEGTNIVKAGAATGSGLTMSTATVLGRTTASSGAIEELSAGTGITISGGTISASGGSGNYTRLADTLLGADTASFDFTSISGSYKHLVILVVGRSNRASNTFDDTLIRLNNDSAGNYDYEWIQWSATATSSAAWNDANAATSIKGVMVPAASSSSGDIGQARYEIYNYAATTLNKGISGSGMALGDRSSGSLRVVQFGGGWRSTAAVTRVTIATVNGSWLAGSRATLYGLD